MKNILIISDLRDVQQRISAITPQSQRQWGTMTIQQMMCHATDQIRLALAQKTGASSSSTSTTTCGSSGCKVTRPGHHDYQIELQRRSCAYAWNTESGTVASLAY